MYPCLYCFVDANVQQGTFSQLDKLELMFTVRTNRKFIRLPRKQGLHKLCS